MKVDPRYFRPTEAQPMQSHINVGFGGDVSIAQLARTVALPGQHHL